MEVPRLSTTELQHTKNQSKPLSLSSDNYLFTGNTAVKLRGIYEYKDQFRSSHGSFEPIATRNILDPRRNGVLSGPGEGELYDNA